MMPRLGLMALRQRLRRYGPARRDRSPRISGLAALLALCLCTVAAAGMDDEPQRDQLDRVRERGALEVAVYKDFPPYSYQDESGRWTGVDVQLAQALADQLQVSLKLRPFQADENMDDDLRNNIWKGHYLGGGVADVMLHVGMDPQYVARSERATLFAPYFHEAVAIAYRPEKFPALESPLKLMAGKVAVEVDSISDYYLSGAFGGRLREVAVRVPSTHEAVALFLSGEADAVMAPRGELQGALQAHGDQSVDYSQTEFAGMFRTAWDIGMAVKAGNPQLEAALRAALERLREEGRLASAFTRYGLDYVAPQIVAGPASAAQLAQARQARGR